MNGHRLVEFIRLVSTNACFLLKNSAILLTISGAVMANDGKITEVLALSGAENFVAVSE